MWLISSNSWLRYPPLKSFGRRLGRGIVGRGILGGIEGGIEGGEGVLRRSRATTIGVEKLLSADSSSSTSSSLSAGLRKKSEKCTTIPFESVYYLQAS